MDKHALIFLFGATGDLAKRKLYPSLFRLYKNGILNKHFAIIGTARREWSHEYYQSIVKEAIDSLSTDEKQKETFISHFYYQAHDVKDQNHYIALKELSQRLDTLYDLKQNRLYYLAMAPHFFGLVTHYLKEQHLLTDEGYNRLIIEKPFGFDYPSASLLNDKICQSFPEKDIFRIDHYLGKEMIQSISAVRFANPLFEKLWNRESIANIQITFSEMLGVENRGEYYETSGALKDMVQNHLLQVVALLAMEPPMRFTSEQIKNEKVKVLQAIRIYNEQEICENIIRGQYQTGLLGEMFSTDYRKETRVSKHSMTETFVSGKLFIDNFRWKDVPFYIRTGKRMKEKTTKISITFKKMAINVFPESPEEMADNILTLYIQPTSGISLSINGKKVGSGYKTTPLSLDYRTSEKVTLNSPEAYEKLLADALNGDRTNFADWEEVAQSWKIVDGIEKVWQKHPESLFFYPAFSYGPIESQTLLENDGFTWLNE